MPRTRKTYAEQLEANENEIQKHVNKIGELKEQKKDIIRRQKAAERNARTKHLVEIGAVAESVLGRKFEEGDKERFLKFLNRQEYNGKYYSRAMNEQSVGKPSENPAKPVDVGNAGSILDGTGRPVTFPDSLIPLFI